jgi:hypothetical protein
LINADEQKSAVQYPRPRISISHSIDTFWEVPSGIVPAVTSILLVEMYDADATLILTISPAIP